jgi:hypothetical protein
MTNVPDYSSYINIKKTSVAQTANSFSATVKGRSTYAYANYFPLYKGLNFPRNSLVSNKFNPGPLRELTPLDIGNCQLWLDAVDPFATGTAPANGTALASWVDKSRAGRTATQTNSSNQPIFQSNILGGNPSVNFNGLSVLNMATYSNNTIPPISMFIITRQTTDTSGQFSISITSGNGIYFRSNTTEGSYTINDGGARNYLPNPKNFDTTSFHIQSFVLPNNAIGNYYFDGTVGDNSNGFTLDRRFFPSINPPPPSLGAYGGSPGSGGLVGFISEVVFYHEVLPLARIQLMEGYLAWKWGLVSNLPSNHPYKNAKPTLLNL